MTKFGLWLKRLEEVLLTTALLKIALGLIGFVLAAPQIEGGAFGPGVYFAAVSVFGAVGLVLLAGNRRDDRATHLAALFLVTASTFIGPFAALQWLSMGFGQWVY